MNPDLQLVTADFETYFSGTYSLSLSSFNTSSYIRNAEFKAHCVSLKIDDNPAKWYSGDAILFALKAIDWRKSAFLAHHAQFDGLILSHHYNIHPAYIYDTLSMARGLHSNAIGVGLDEVAGFYRQGHKTPKVLLKMKGMRDPTESQMDELGKYCANDVELCYGIFQQMLPKFPASELDLIDLTMRMFTSPVLELDMPRLKDELVREQEEKARIIANCGVSLTVLSSSEKFAHELQCSGVQNPPTKISPTTKLPTWAFSKTDLDFLDLRGHESERVRNLVTARLAAKSTLHESRAKRLIDAGRNGFGFPVYLKYYGAHTGRWSGGDKLNVQNFPRPQYDDAKQYVYPSAELRRSIMAPPGHQIVVVDSAQIEARVLSWLAEDTEMLNLFRANADVYKHMAAKIYHCEVENVTKDQRFIGKVATLGLGYGMGRDKFKLTLALGNMGPVKYLSEDEAWHIVQTYRNSREPVARLWRQLEAILYSMVKGRNGSFRSLIWRGDEKRVYLPNDMYLQYPYLEQGNQGGYQFFDYKAILRKKFKGTMEDNEGGKFIHGGSFTENVVQALARIIIGEQMLHIQNHLAEVGDGFFRRIVTMSHDEIVVVAPTGEADAVLAYMLQVMKSPPSWAATLPLGAEGGYAEIYSK